jgi:hypothetical protein
MTEPDAPLWLIDTEVVSAMPDRFGRKGTRTGRSDANRPDRPTGCMARKS